MKRISLFCGKFVNFLKDIFKDRIDSKTLKKQLAFNMLEVTISLIVIACIASAFVPVVTKKIFHSSLAIRQAKEVITDCSGVKVNGGELDGDCKACYPNGKLLSGSCVICNKSCRSDQAKIISTCSCEDCSKRDPACVKCTDLAMGAKKCERCKAGYYLAHDGSKCIKCPAGNYCPEPSSCPIPCKDKQWTNVDGGSGVCDFGCGLNSKGEPVGGKYCHTIDKNFNGGRCGREHVQEDCWKGHYCPYGDLMKKCGKMQYQDEKGKASCKFCAKGKYSTDIARETSCTENCPKGHYCTGIDGYVGKCPAGSYCPNPSPKDKNTGSFEPTLTDCGYYQDKEGKWEQKACPDGQYQDKTGSTACVDTPAGHYRNNDRCGTTCCPPGKWSTKGSKESNTVSGCTEDNCGSGYWCKSCQREECTPGHYCPKGSSAEINCPPGYYQNKKGKTSCEYCPDGQWSDEEADNINKCSEAKCGPGYYCKQGKKEPCNKGYYCPTGSSKPENCPAGHKCPDERMSSPTPCDPGQYQDKEAQTSCTCCDAGKFNGLSGQKSCGTNCPVGTYSTGCASSCVCCAARYWSSIEGRKSSCTDLCPHGHYCKGSGDCIKHQCNCGYYSSAGSTGCSACKSGYYSVAGSEKCTACPAGHTCTACAIGDECQEGHASPLGNNTCYPCEKGTFAAGAGNSSCSDCPAGYYQDKTGQKSCVPCPDGEYYSNTRANDVKLCTKPNCGPGYYCKDGTKNPCPKGHYCPEGSPEPIECPPGTYQDETAKDTCKSCTCGRWGDSGRKTDCEATSLCTEGYACKDGVKTKCTKGQYAPAGSCTCESCPPGYYQNKEAQPKCEYCSPGKWGETGRQTDCTAKCDCGYACLNGSKTQCSPGKYAPAGQSSCADCLKGHYYTSDRCSCPACSEGQYQPDDGQSLCIYCPVGHYQPDKGAISCDLECPAGKYSNAGKDKTGSTGCNTCPTDYIQTKTGMSYCDSCDSIKGPNAKRFTNNGDHTACSECEPGYEKYENTCIQKWCSTHNARQRVGQYCFRKKNAGHLDGYLRFRDYKGYKFHANSDPQKSYATIKIGNNTIKIVLAGSGVSCDTDKYACCWDRALYNPATNKLILDKNVNRTAHDCVKCLETDIDDGDEKDKDTYSGCRRTVCNWKAAKLLCNYRLQEVDGISRGQWRLPTASELSYVLTTMKIEKAFIGHAKADSPPVDGLRLCDGGSGNDDDEDDVNVSVTQHTCPRANYTDAFCKGAHWKKWNCDVAKKYASIYDYEYQDNCMPHLIWTSDTTEIKRDLRKSAKDATCLKDQKITQARTLGIQDNSFKNIYHTVTGAHSVRCIVDLDADYLLHPLYKDKDTSVDND